MYIHMVFVSKYIVPKGFRGITLYPFIFLRSTHDMLNKRLVYHERIHLRQQLELLVIPFYVLYILEWLVRLCYYRNRHKAYVNLSFEREAYCNEHDFTYLKNRKWFSFIHYL